MSKLVSKPPVYAVILDYSTHNVGPSSYVELVSSLPAPSQTAEIFNGSGSALYIGVGSAGNEVPIKYITLPGGSNLALSLNFSHGDRISLKTADGTTASVGSFVLNLFG